MIKVYESDDYGFNGKGAKTIKLIPGYERNGSLTYYTTQNQIDDLHNDHSAYIWVTDSKGNIRDGRVEAGWTVTIDMIDSNWLKRNGFDISDRGEDKVKVAYYTRY